MKETEVIAEEWGKRETEKRDRERKKEKFEADVCGRLGAPLRLGKIMGVVDAIRRNQKVMRGSRVEQVRASAERDGTHREPGSGKRLCRNGRR